MVDRRDPQRFEKVRSVRHRLIATANCGNKLNIQLVVVALFLALRPSKLNTVRNKQKRSKFQLAFHAEVFGCKVILITIGKKFVKGSKLFIGNIFALVFHKCLFLVISFVGGSNSAFNLSNFFFRRSSEKGNDETAATLSPVM